MRTRALLMIDWIIRFAHNYFRLGKNLIPFVCQRNLGQRSVQVVNSNLFGRTLHMILRACSDVSYAFVLLKFMMLIAYMLLFCLYDYA